MTLTFVESAVPTKASENRTANAAHYAQNEHTEPRRNAAGFVRR
jgi:hypothetical protein